MKAQYALWRTKINLQLLPEVSHSTLKEHRNRLETFFFFFFSPTSELGWISKVYVNPPAVVRHAEQIQKWRTVKGNWQVSALFMHSVPVFLKQSLSLSKLKY